MRTSWWAALGAVALHAAAAGATDDEGAAAATEAPPDDADAGDADAGDDTGDVEDDEGDEDRPAPPPDPVRKGLALQGSLGLSDCLGGFCSHGNENQMESSRIGLGIEITGWYRPFALASFGGGVHYNLIGIKDRERVDTSADYFSFELGGRFHPLQTGPIDAYAGLTLGYVVYGVSAHMTQQDLEINETTNGFMLGLHAGGEWYLAPRMSLGGVLEVKIPSWLDQCFETILDDGSSPPQEDCDTISDLPPSLQSHFPASIWYLGGTFTYHLGG